MNNYKIFILILPILFVVPLSAQNIQLFLPDTTCYRGDLITIPVLVQTELTGRNVTSYQLNIQFSEYVLAIDTILTSGTITGTAGMSCYFSKPKPNEITIAAAGANSLSGTGTLVRIRFKAIHSGYSALHFTDTMRNVLNEGAPSVLLDDGSVIANEPPTITIYPDEKILAVGEGFDFDIYNATDPVQWSVTNPLLASIDTLGVLTALQSGFIKVAASDALGLKDTTNGIIEIRPFKLSMHDTSATIGQVIELPIYTTSVTNLGIVSGAITISFNGSALSPAALITNGCVLASHSNVTLNTSISGKVKIAFAGTSPLSGEGILCKIRFTAAQANWSNLEFTEALFNESILARTVNGSVQVNSAAMLNVEPKTSNLIVGDTLKFNLTNGTPPYTWEVSDTTLANINNNGCLVAKKSGVLHAVVHDALSASGVTDDIIIHNTKISIGELYVVAGTNIDVPVRIDRFNGGDNLISFETIINFDSSAVKAIAVINEGTLSEGWMYAQLNYGNRISIAASGTLGFHTTGALFKIRFQVIGSLPVEFYTPISFNRIRLNEGNPSVLTSNGGLRVVDIPSVPSLISPYEGEYNLPHDVLFNWYAPLRAERYRLQVAKNNSFSPIVLDDSLITASSRLVLALENSLYYWRVNASNIAGTGQWSEIRSFFVGPQVGVNENNIAPKQFALMQNYPNPFNPTTTIDFTIANDGLTTLKIFDVLGREVTTLVNGELKAGALYRVHFNASNLTSGIYFYQLTCKNQTQVNKLVLMK